MFYGLSKILKNILPKRLFYRALLIVAVPVIVLQLIITFVFFEASSQLEQEKTTRMRLNKNPFL